MSSLKEKKQALRKEVLSEREQIPESDWELKSNQIIATLKDTEFYKKAKMVHTYISMNKRREVCTDPLLRDLVQSQKTVVVPITNFSKGTLTHSKISSVDELKKNKWGVREPRKINPVDVSSLDVIIIPMAAADRSGNRLGYGKGFYDRFLAEAQALKVGLTFHKFLFDEIPVEDFDIKLDVIITEEEVIFA